MLANFEAHVASLEDDFDASLAERARKCLAMHETADGRLKCH